MIIDTLTWLMEGDNTKLKRDVNEADKSVKQLDKSIQQTDNSASELMGSLKKLFTGAAILAGAKMLGDITKEQTELGVRMAETADILGVSRQAVADYSAGVAEAGGDLNAGLQQLEGFNARLAQNEEALNDAGIATRGTNNEWLDSITILDDLNQALQKMDGAARGRMLRRMGLDARNLPGKVQGNTPIFDGDFIETSMKIKKVQDQISNARSKIAAELGDIFQPMLRQIKELERDLTGFVQRNLKPLLSMAGGAAGLVVLKMISMAFKRLGGAVSIVGRLLMRFWPFALFEGAMAIVGKLWGELSDPDVRDSFLGQLKESLPNLTGLIEDVIDLFGDGIEWATNQWDRLMAAIGVTNGWELLGKIIGGILSNVERLIGWLKMIPKVLKGELGVMDFLKATPGKEAVGSMFGAIGTLASGAVTALTGADTATRNINAAHGEALIQNSSKSNSVMDNRKISIRPVYNIRTNQSPEEIAKIADERLDLRVADLQTSYANGGY